MWVHSGIREAEEEATREGRLQPTVFTNEEVASIVPVDPTNEDADTEEDLNRAVEDGFSIATEESITVIDDEIPPDDMGDVEIIPGVEEWDVIESSTYCCGQTAR